MHDIELEKKYIKDLSDLSSSWSRSERASAILSACVQSCIYRGMTKKDFLDACKENFDIVSNHINKNKQH